MTDCTDCAAVDVCTACGNSKLVSTPGNTCIDTCEGGSVENSGVCELDCTAT